MKRYAIATALPKFNPRQGLFFVMSSRRADARVLEAHIGSDDAKRHARQLGSCVRYGYIVDGVAETI